MLPRRDLELLQLHNDCTLLLRMVVRVDLLQVVVSDSDILIYGVELD